MTELVLSIFADMYASVQKKFISIQIVITGVKKNIGIHPYKSTKWLTLTSINTCDVYTFPHRTFLGVSI